MKTFRSLFSGEGLGEALGDCPPTIRLHLQHRPRSSGEGTYQLGHRTGGVQRGVPSHGQSKTWAFSYLHIEIYVILSF